MSDKEKRLRLLKALLLVKLGEHFMKEAMSDKHMAYSDYNIRESSGGAEQGSMIHLDVFHYGVENYYGTEIYDIFKKIKEEEK